MANVIFVGIYFVISLVIVALVMIFAIIQISKTKVENAIIVDKRTDSIGALRYIIAEINGEKVELRTNYYVYQNLQVGEEVMLWYNHGYCSRFSK